MDRWGKGAGGYWHDPHDQLLASQDPGNSQEAFNQIGRADVSGVQASRVIVAF